MQWGQHKMVMQEAQLNAPEASASEHPRSGKLIALITSAAVLAIVAAIGVYFVAFRSLPTTVSWAPSVSAVSPGGDLTVSGQVTPAESGRLVSVEVAPFESVFKGQGPWQPMPQSATTDTRGRFSITYKTHFPVSIVMQVMVDPAGRYLGVTGAPKPVRLLVLSSISLKGGGTLPTGTPITFTVSVDPISAGRTVQIEQSSDKVRWVPVGPTAQTKGDGTSLVKVPAPGVGVWSYRATVANDDNFAAAVSPVVGAKVEDIKAAKAKAAAAAKAKGVAEAEAAKAARTKETTDTSAPQSASVRRDGNGFALGGPAMPGAPANYEHPSQSECLKFRDQLRAWSNYQNARRPIGAISNLPSSGEVQYLHMFCHLDY
jgi:hypothetical protein